MRFLTVYSAFFMPLTFLVGIYGMNFKNMPELESSIGYPGVWVLMLLVTGLHLWWFRRKRWL
jgi:magnesium transporter